MQPGSERGQSIQARDCDGDRVERQLLRFLKVVFFPDSSADSSVRAKKPGF